MSTTNVGADDTPWVDGNALAGPLGEIIGTDLTVAELTCAGCRTTRPLAAMRVFDRAPGLVARCPGCQDVVMRVVRTTGHVLVDLRGSLVLSVPAQVPERHFIRLTGQSQVAHQMRDQGDNMASNVEDMITLTSAEQDSGGSNLSGATAPDTEDLVITDNSELGTYEATIGGRTAAGLVYNKVGNRVTLIATSVLPEFRGKGVAARLIGGVLDELRSQGKTATVTCPFTAAFVNAHPEYSDVLDPAFSGPRTSTGQGHGH